HRRGVQGDGAGGAERGILGGAGGGQRDAAAREAVAGAAQHDVAAGGRERDVADDRDAGGLRDAAGGRHGQVAGHRRAGGRGDVLAVGDVDGVRAGVDQLDRTREHVAGAVERDGAAGRGDVGGQADGGGAATRLGDGAGGGVDGQVARHRRGVQG